MFVFDPLLLNLIPVTPSLVSSTFSLLKSYRLVLCLIFYTCFFISKIGSPSSKIILYAYRSTVNLKILPLICKLQNILKGFKDIRLNSPLSYVVSSFHPFLHSLLYYSDTNTSTQRSVFLGDVSNRPEGDVSSQTSDILLCLPNFVSTLLRFPTSLFSSPLCFSFRNPSLLYYRFCYKNFLYRIFFNKTFLSLVYLSV